MRWWPRAVLGLAAVLAATAIWFARGERRPPPAPVPRNDGRRGSAATPRPQAAVARTPDPPATRHATAIRPWESEPTPEPSPVEDDETPTPRLGPSPTPAVPECVEIAWSSGMSPVNIAQVLVEIRAANRCGRDLAPLEVWFDIGGYRNGERIQTARGHLLDPLPAGSSGKAVIALPGSADWYDRIDVAVARLTTP